MNLGKLLGAGKSFFDGCRVVSYRRDKRVYLPKFNSDKNPFEPKSAGASVPMAPAAAPEAGLAKPVVKARAGTVPAAAMAKPARASNWADLINPFRRPETPTAEPSKPVQVELSLQAVKVLHNDLSDADVEVVPVKSRTLTAVEAPRVLPGREPLEMFAECRFETA